MEINFQNIEYLKFGTKRQQEAYSVLADNQILIKLRKHNPILVGTIPINIDIKDSDLDVICHFDDILEFQKTISDTFKNERGFTIREHQNLEQPTIVANFFIGDFEIEIFGQNIPTNQQMAYRHLIVEHKLLNQYGEKFRKQIIKLKEEGNKTEPAFAIALNLEGNPYIELLKFE